MVYWVEGKRVGWFCEARWKEVEDRKCTPPSWVSVKPVRMMAEVRSGVCVARALVRREPQEWPMWRRWVGGTDRWREGEPVRARWVREVRREEGQGWEEAFGAAAEMTGWLIDE